MAFNPFTGFRKYQKFWMATLVGMSMLTFVLCTGLGQGGLEDRILRMFGGNQGPEMGKLNNRVVYQRELTDLKMQRNVANDFMRKFCTRLIDNANLAVKSVQEKSTDDKVKQDTVVKAAQIRREFGERLKKPRYFQGGVKTEDLFDFKIWLAEADRLGIQLDGNAVRVLLDEDMLHNQLTHGFRNIQQDPDIPAVMSQVRGNNNFANDSYITNALRNEFRVRIAQLAVLTCQPDIYLQEAALPRDRERKFQEVRATPTLAQLWEYYKENRAVWEEAVVAVDVRDFLKDVPEPTEQELQKFFDTYRSAPFDPSSAKPGFQIPHQLKVQWVTADPNSRTYRNLGKVIEGLQFHSPATFAPMMPPLLNAVGIELSNQAQKKHYQDLFMLELQTVQGAALRHLFVPHASGNFQATMADFQAYETPEAIVAFLGGVATSDSLLTSPVLARHVVLDKNKKMYPDLVKEEVKKRVGPYAAAITLGVHGPFHFAGPWWASLRDVQFMPLPLIEAKLQAKSEKALAGKFVMNTMKDVRRALENPPVIGKATPMERSLQELALVYGGPPYQALRTPEGVAGFVAGLAAPQDALTAAGARSVGYRPGFERYSSKDFYNRYTIRTAPEMEPLRKAYQKYYNQINVIEGRGGTERNLRDTDFDRLFFEKDSYSATANYFARPWPPEVQPSTVPLTSFGEDFPGATPETAKILKQRQLDQLFHPTREQPKVDLFMDAEQPILFWKSEDKSATAPDSLAQVRDRVVQAWKLEKAREKAFPAAKAIAKELQLPGNLDLLAKARTESAKLGHDAIILRDMALLYLSGASDQASRRYGTYQLPKDTVPYFKEGSYLRDDTVKNLLSLGNPKDPVKIDDKELDAENKTLFENYKNSAAAKEGVRPIVQILTNQPRTLFFVAVPLSKPAANPIGFEHALRFGGGAPHFGALRENDTFLQVAFDGISKDALKTHVEMLRERMGWKVPDSEAKTSFDNDSSS